MNAHDFARGLAERVGREPNQLLIFDRAIADAGLRSKARGRHSPDITTEEAVKTLLAFLSGRPALHAAESAAALSRFTLQAAQGERTLEALHYLMGRESPVSEFCDLTLSEVLVRLCKRLAQGLIGADNGVWVEVRDGAIVTIQADLAWMPDNRDTRLGIKAEIVFTGVVSIPTDVSRGNYFETRTVSSALLSWIGAVTA